MIMELEIKGFQASMCSTMAENERGRRRGRREKREKNQERERNEILSLRITKIKVCNWINESKIPKVRKYIPAQQVSRVPLKFYLKILLGP